MMKIITRIKGGLGNQLFCYAAARRLALANHAELVLDDVSGFVRDHEYQRHYQLGHFNIPFRKATPAERLEPMSRVRRYLKRAMNRRRPFEARRYIQQEGIDFDCRLLTVKPRGTVYLEGYWQSEQYFKDVEATIREELRIIPPKDKINRAMAERIRSCLAVAVHVRFFDAPQEIGVNNASGDYYARAVARMECLAPDAHYFVFSDQPAAARDRIPLPDDRITLVSHNQGDENAYADLWLMTQCQHFIIANSTFSWWGGWLGGCKEKIVIYPDLEMRQDKSAPFNLSGDQPTGWIKL
ncbi:MAG: alpha-1,2-fucosyltransferase [Hydrogenophilales bacterium 17-64-65]|nr:MAG: alpha-1,2-fucosyltransferase [Hydrogenophilales bacterium 16-64-40]OZA31885.1 MAG: alpha-1,2-fucosyltransferase [Hydrogenophilales bacterium 17-64-65]